MPWSKGDIPMDTEGELLERRLSRKDVLKLAALTGGAGLRAGRVAAADAAGLRLGAESGRRQARDWAGYGVKQVWQPYLKKDPGQPPEVTFMPHEAEARGKLPT